MLRTRLFASVLLLATGTLAVAAIRPSTQEPVEPTKQHEMLMKSVGEWEGTATLFVPGMPSTPVPATETVAAFGPFWTTTDFKSVLMGVPYNGRGSFGYDPAKGKFLGTWIDSLSPNLSVMEGDFDEASRSITMRWEGPDMTGTIVPQRSVNVMGEDSYTMTFFMGEGEGNQEHGDQDDAQSRQAGRGWQPPIAVPARAASRRPPPATLRAA